MALTHQWPTDAPLSTVQHKLTELLVWPERTYVHKRRQHLRRKVLRLMNCLYMALHRDSESMLCGGVEKSPWPLPRVHI